MIKLYKRVQYKNNKVAAANDGNEMIHSVRHSDLNTERVHINHCTTENNYENRITEQHRGDIPNTA